MEKMILLMEILFIIYAEIFFCKTSKNLRCQEVF